MVLKQYAWMGQLVLAKQIKVHVANMVALINGLADD